MLYQWLRAHDGHPCISMPTGSGKSHVISGLCQDALTSWPETRVLVLSHVRELLEQDAAKILDAWPEAPLGICSAGLGRREFSESITVAGIQTVRDRADDIGHVDLVVVDEAHLISHQAQGGYRRLLGNLCKINPHLRLIGLTATPYRLGHGMITDKPALFDALIEPVTIEELVRLGYLAPLHSKLPQEKLSTAGVKIRGREYVQKDLQAAVADRDQTARIVRETIRLAGDRKSWLIFCVGVAHAEDITGELRRQGIPAETVLGATPTRERDEILARFRSGELRAVANVGVLSTGFDYPDIDLIAFCRPTLSPGLYCQMAGRGMRVKSHTDHCLVLDYAGNVSTHGPITAIEPPTRQGRITGEAPVKICPACQELCHLSAKECPACGELFPPPEPKKLHFHNDDIMGAKGHEMEISSWAWSPHISKSSGKAMLRVTYYGALSDPPIVDYLPLTHEGYAGQKAMATLTQLAQRSGASLPAKASLEEISEVMESATAPSKVNYIKKGKYYRITERTWDYQGESH